MANVSRKPDVKLTHLAIHPCTSMHPYPRLLSEECIFTDTHPWTICTIVSIHIPRHQHLRVMLQTNEHKVASDQSSDPATRPPVHCRVLVYMPSRFPALPAAPEHTSGLLPAGRPASLSPGQTGWSAEMLQGCWCILSMFAVKRLPGLWFRLWGEFRLWILEFSVQ